MYTAVKSLNNNLVLACNDKGEEVVLFGTGIGFKKKKGDDVDASLVTKTFSRKEYPGMSLVVESISPEVLTVSERIVTMGEEHLEKKLSKSLFISLGDHIQNALEHQRDGLIYEDNTLQWEIPFLYHNESMIGTKALEIIESELGVSLPKLEAAFIALHFINAQDGMETMNETIQITKIIKSMVKTIQSLFDVSLNKESMNYSRFVTHVRYFMNRQLHNKELATDQNEKLYQIIQEQYPKSYGCALMIREMLKNEYDIFVSNDEMIYLIIHIERVVSEIK